jgi:hypothetical protein
MKKLYLKRLRKITMLIVFITACLSAFSVDNLEVSGVTNPTAANGTYIWQGVHNDHNYWENSNGWIIFWHSGYSEWEINPIIDYDDTVDEYYSWDTSDVDPPVTSSTGPWSYNVTYGFVDMVIVSVASGTAPTVSTQAVSSISTSSATGNGNITDLGSPNPTAHGVCWNTGGTPTTSDGVVDEGGASSTGTFTASITSLSANTLYYVRAYATNTEGTSYGAQVSFTTDPEAATVTTQAVDNIFTETATGYGNITDLGAPNPTAHGVCWNTGGTPTTSDGVVDNGAASSTGSFAASISSLSPNTLYYVRAYATNTVGTSYGAQVSFTTDPEVATVTTQAVSDILTTTAIGNGNITDLGSPNPTAHGVCWNTGGTPTTSDGVVDNGAASTTGAFTASITSLSASTLYYVRAYATNDAGTSYGAQVSFTSADLVAATVTTQAVSDILTTTATGNGNITDLGAPNPTAHGVCWNTTGTPTTSDDVVDNGTADATGAFTASMTSLTQNMTYYVRAYATNDAGTSYGTEESFTTNASGICQWVYIGGTTNWSERDNWIIGGLPGSNSIVTILSGDVVVDGDYECTSLTINADQSVTIDPGNTLTVSGTLTNSAGESGLVLQSDATGTGMLLNSSTGVQATVQQYLVKDQWHYMGIPTTYLTDANDVYHNCYLAWIHENNAQSTSELGWEYLTAGDSLLAMHGYAVQYNRTDSDVDTTISFTGTLNAGIVDTVFSSALQGLNFVSNPYPVTMDWSTADVVTSSTDYTYPINMRNMYDAIYLYNPSLSTYGSWVDGVSVNDQTQYIPPMQGFFIQVYNVDASLSFTDDCKVTDKVAFKSTQITPLIRLGISDNNESFDETVIRIKAIATTDFDRQYDASKMIATTSNLPQLYSITGDEKYSINSLPEITEDLVIPLEVLVKNSGEQRLTIKELENYSGEYPINLFNTQGDLLANLETEDYIFNAEKGETFQLILGFSHTTVGIDEMVEQNVFLTSEGSILNIKQLANIPAEVFIHNVNGQCIYRENLITESVSINLQKQGIYIVNVLFEDGSIFNGKATINF